jgi:raffinose/stachyose/melibiose transport system substrate-binding protein
VIRELMEAGAFADNAAATYESASTRQFLAKEAAMQFDGSWMVSSIPPDLMDTVAVLPMPLRNGEGTSECYLGGVSMGFYLTRRAWNSGRRDAAVQLLAELTSTDSLQRLGNIQLSGKLQASAEKMREGRTMVSPLQDAMNRNARETWLLECIPAVAAGNMTAEECWEKVMALSPFGE